MRLGQKVAIVTGAGAGFGAGIATRFAAEGARVVCADLDRKSAEAIASSLGGRHLAVQCDVADGASVAALIAETAGVMGGFDILVNNAALTQKPARIAKTPERDVDRLFAVNVKSLYHMAVHALPALRQRGGGAIVNIASVAAIRPRPGMTWYNATKAAVITISQSMAAELAADKIRVNVIAPVAGRTAMFDVMFGENADAASERLLESIPLGRLCTPDDIAAAAVYLASDEAAFVTGVVLPVDGGRLVG